MNIGKLVGSRVTNYQKLDITFNTVDTNRVEDGVNTIEFSKKLLKRMQFLKEVTLILKEVLADNGLNVPFKGGISSYAILLLCAAYYSIYPKFESSGECLLRVLDFYANYFNNMLYGIFYDGNVV